MINFNEKLKQNNTSVLQSDNRKMLLDNWQASGNKKEKMFNYLERLENATKIIQTRSDVIQIFTLDKTDPDEKKFVGYRHGAEYGTIEDYIPFSRLRKYDGMTDSIYDEVKKTKMLFVIGNGIYFTTKKVLPTLAQRAGSSTGKFAAMDSLKIRFHRDAGYVAFMEASPSPCNIMLREYGNAKKIFAVFSDGYTVISQKELINAVMTYGESIMGSSNIYYRIDNFGTSINLEFPDYKKFQVFEKLKGNVSPGILVQMSDTGDSAFSITGTLRMQTGICYVPGAFYTRKHTKNAEVGEIAEEAFKQILPKFEKYPKLIKKLSDISISDYEETAKKAAAYCGIKSSVSAKAESNVLDVALDSLKEISHCTAYDIASSIIEACDVIADDSCDKMADKLHSCSEKALLFKYDKAR